MSTTTKTETARDLAISLVRQMIDEATAGRHGYGDSERVFRVLRDEGVFGIHKSEVKAAVLEIMDGLHMASDEGKHAAGLVDWGNQWPVVDGDGDFNGDVYDSDQNSRSANVTIVDWDEDHGQLVADGCDAATFARVYPVDEDEDDADEE